MTILFFFLKYNKNTPSQGKNVFKSFKYILTIFQTVSKYS